MTHISLPTCEDNSFTCLDIVFLLSVLGHPVSGISVSRYELEIDDFRAWVSGCQKLFVCFLGFEVNTIGFGSHVHVFGF